MYPKEAQIFTSPKRVLNALPIIAAISFLPGCYEHVVRAEGDAARGRPVHEPALKDERTFVDDLEDAIMGPKR